MSIVVGYLPTAEGRAAVEAAIAEARLRKLPMVVVNASRGGAYVDVGKAEDADLLKIRKQLADAEVDYQVMQPSGVDPAQAILDAAHGADLLVIGLRRRTPVGKFLMGSTAQQLLLEADCPVLAVKA